MTVSGDPPSGPDQRLPRLDQPHKRPYLSIFGAIDIERTCYGHDRVEAVPLDSQLHLPQRQYSYLLQKWLGSFRGRRCSRRGDPEAGGRSSAWRSPSRASEDLNREQASDVELFQDRLPVPEAADEGPLLVVTADCKGVPLVRQALPPDEATDTPLPKLANPRRGKGEEGEQEEDGGGGGGVYDRSVWAHGDDVIDEVMRKKARERRPRPQNKRVRAELLVGKVALSCGWRMR